MKGPLVAVFTYVYRRRDVQRWDARQAGGRVTGLGKIAMALGFNVKATPDLLMEGLNVGALSLQDFKVFM